MKYFVTMAGRTVEVEVDGDVILVDGRETKAELRTLAGTPVRNLFVDGESWIVSVEAGRPGEWLLGRRGERFEAEVLDERTRHLRSLVGEGGPVHGAPAVRAPMPGLVVRVLVEAGQEVTAGAGLVVLEAMKMENELKAVAAGVVEEVAVKPGQAVEKGAVLVRFRSEG